MKKCLLLLFLCALFMIKASPSAGFGLFSFSLHHNITASNTSIGDEPPFPGVDTLKEQFDISVSVGMSNPRTGFNHQGGIMIENEYFSTATGISLTVTYDTAAVFISSSLVPLTTSPGMLTFYFDTLHSLDQQFIYLDFSVPANLSLLGHSLWLTASVSSLSIDQNLTNNEDNIEKKITGAFDPNTKAVVPEGFGPPNYVPVSQEEFKYTIDFQNTGTDTAFNVMIVDTISSYLDPVTIQPGASSHPYSWELLSPGIIKFHFNNIMLPDSGVNEPRSHGFITYTIKARQGLLVGTNIKNTAYVFFDSNPPEITNTTANELFDCSNISDFHLTQNNLCGGELLAVNQLTVVPHITQWYMDSTWLATGDSFVFSSYIKGLHQVIMIAQTPYCNQVVYRTINIIIPPKPVITQNGTLLISSPANSYQWTLNGVIMMSAQFNTLQTIQAGWYGVITTDPFGCRAVSDSVFVSSVGIADNKSWEAFQAAPNPFRDELVITIDINETCVAEILDLQGRIIETTEIGAGQRKVTLQTGNLRNGVYMLRLTGKGIKQHKLITKN